MLQSIRDHTHGWIAGIIVSLLILSFALWGIHSYLEAGGSNNIVAKVNGVEITKNQYTVTYDRLRRELQMQYGAGSQLPLQVETVLKERALQTLISVQVLKQASLSENYRISPVQVDSFLEAMPEFQVNGEFSLARFQQALTSTLFSMSDFLDLVNTSLLIDQPKLGIVSTSFALPNEINNTMRLVEQEREISYALITQDYFARESLNVTDASIQAYYHEHQDDFKTPEQVSIEYIELSVKNLINNLQPTEEALKNYYNENTNSFLQLAQWQLDKIVISLPANATEKEVALAQNQMIAIGEAAKMKNNFVHLQGQYPNIKITKDKSWVTINEIPLELRKSVLELKKLGQMTLPIRTQDSIVLLNVTGYKEPKTELYAVVKNKVKEMVIHQQAEEQFSTLREKLANLTYEHPDSLAPAAKELGIPLKVSAVFAKDSAIKDITGLPKVKEAAYSNDVLNLQNNSEVIQISPDTAIVLRVKSHIPAALLPLDSVKNQITVKLKQVIIANKMRELAQEIETKLQKRTLTIEQAKQQYHLQWIEPGFVKRHTGKHDQAILDAAFKMPKPEGNQPNYAMTKVSNNFAIISLSVIKDGTKVSSDYQAFAEQVQNALGALEYDLYKESLMQNAKISK